MTITPTSLEELTDAQLFFLFCETGSMAVSNERLRRATLKGKEQRRQRRVRAFGRKRRLLRALWPLRQITAGMEGKRQKPWLDNPNWVLAEARRRRDEGI